MHVCMYARMNGDLQAPCAVERRFQEWSHNSWRSVRSRPSMPSMPFVGQSLASHVSHVDHHPNVDLYFIAAHLVGSWYTRESLLVLSALVHSRALEYTALCSHEHTRTRARVETAPLAHLHIMAYTQLPLVSGRSISTLSTPISHLTIGVRVRLLRLPLVFYDSPSPAGRSLLHNPSPPLPQLAPRTSPPCSPPPPPS